VWYQLGKAYTSIHITIATNNLLSCVLMVSHRYRGCLSTSPAGLSADGFFSNHIVLYMSD